MTPSFYAESADSAFASIFIVSTGDYSMSSASASEDVLGIRPVINLYKDVVITNPNQDGTIGNEYEIKIN